MFGQALIGAPRQLARGVLLVAVSLMLAGGVNGAPPDRANGGRRGDSGAGAASGRGSSVGSTFNRSTGSPGGSSSGRQSSGIGSGSGFRSLQPSNGSGAGSFTPRSGIGSSGSGSVGGGRFVAPQVTPRSQFNPSSGSLGNSSRGFRPSDNVGGGLSTGGGITNKNRNLTPNLGNIGNPNGRLGGTPRIRVPEGNGSPGTNPSLVNPNGNRPVIDPQFGRGKLGKGNNSLPSNGDQPSGNTPTIKKPNNPSIVGPGNRRRIDDVIGGGRGKELLPGNGGNGDSSGKGRVRDLIPRGDAKIGDANGNGLDKPRLIPRPRIDIGRNGNKKDVKPIDLDIDLGRGGRNRDFVNRLREGQFEHLGRTRSGKALDLNRKISLLDRGDVSRRLNLADALRRDGGWRNRKLIGPVSPKFTHSHFSAWYCGPGHYPAYCWAPHWNHWVAWCWWDYCYPICDPRPLICRPIYCTAAPLWVWWDCPIWEPLPIVTCGTWVDVPIVINDAGLDLQLLAVRFVDPGHAEQGFGPRYRLWMVNKSRVSIANPFNVTLIASNERELTPGLPESGVRVETLAPEQVLSVDVRLPAEVNRMGTDPAGHKVPFSFLHVLIDSHNEVADIFRPNNGASLDRRDVLAVDPAAFSTDVDVLASGSEVSIAGEGLGPEPGKVIVFVAGVEREAQIEGWYDLGVRITLPDLPLAVATEGQIIIVRGDGAAANPLDVTFTPSEPQIVLPLPQ